MRFFREWNSTPRNVCRTDSFCNQLGSVAQRSRIILLSSLLLSALPTILPRKTLRSPSHLKKSLHPRYLAWNYFVGSLNQILGIA